MQTRRNKGICVLLVLLLLCSSCLPAMAAPVTNTQLETAVQRSAAYVQKTVTAPQLATIGGEWAVLGLARSGAAVPQSYWDTYYSNVEASVKAQAGVLDSRKYTEYARVTLALTAIGKNPADVAGYNLLTPLGDFRKVVQQGINGPVWALIALDSGNYAMPVNSTAQVQATRQMYLDEILSRQLQNGGWNLSDKGGDGKINADITGMVLQALANYQEQERVKAATDRALQCLSKLQQPDGSFGDSAESIVQVLVGLCALGIDWNDARFVKNGHTLLDALFSYQQPDGSFRHTKSGAGNSQMATEQGLYAMAAALRLLEGKSSLYDMREDTGKLPAASFNETSNKISDEMSDKTAAAERSAVREWSQEEQLALQRSIVVLLRTLCGSLS